jgi:hypothetical protein
VNPTPSRRCSGSSSSPTTTVGSAFEDALADLLQAEPAFAEDIRRLVEDASHITQTNYTQITDAGTVAVEGDVNLRGTYVAGRDLTAGPAAEDSER